MTNLTQRPHSVVTKPKLVEISSNKSAEPIKGEIPKESTSPESEVHTKMLTGLDQSSKGRSAMNVLVNCCLALATVVSALTLMVILTVFGMVFVRFWRNIRMKVEDSHQQPQRQKTLNADELPTALFSI